MGGAAETIKRLYHTNPGGQQESEQKQTRGTTKKKTEARGI